MLFSCYCAGANSSGDHLGQLCQVQLKLIDGLQEDFGPQGGREARCWHPRSPINA